MNVKAVLMTAGRWALVCTIVIGALIGFLHFTRGTAVRHVRGVGADGRLWPPSEPQFSLSVAMLTRCGRRPHG